MRDYKNIDYYLTKLAGDIYPQPEDPGHTALAQKIVDLWMSRMTSVSSVLDLGCGQGMCQPMFEKWGVEYKGVALGTDVVRAREQSRNVLKMDFHFLDFEDNSIDLLFARHALEHSPMPLLALMEWNRVSRNWLGLVMPAPEWYTYTGINHYSVMNHEQVENILARAGWKVVWNEIDYLTKNITDEHPQGTQTPHEYWIMCEKAK